MSSETKQVIVIRKDLNMRKGKMIAQGAHASMAFLTSRLKNDIVEWATAIKPAIFMPTWPFTVELTPEEMEWIAESFAKITVYVNSEAELIEVQEKAKEAGLNTYAIVDNGLTEFNGVPTLTCISIGPAKVERFVGVTDQLPLL